MLLVNYVFLYIMIFAVSSIIDDSVMQFNFVIFSAVVFHNIVYLVMHFFLIRNNIGYLVMRVFHHYFCY